MKPQYYCDCSDLSLLNSYASDWLLRFMQQHPIGLYRLETTLDMVEELLALRQMAAKKPRLIQRLFKRGKKNGRS
jgi:hypothetical protein